MDDGEAHRIVNVHWGGPGGLPESCIQSTGRSKREKSCCSFPHPLSPISHICWWTGAHPLPDRIHVCRRQAQLSVGPPHTHSSPLVTVSLAPQVRTNVSWTLTPLGERHFCCEVGETKVQFTWVDVVLPLGRSHSLEGRSSP